ncbi:ribonuclease HII [Clostridium aceticum]|uniref:Ribonuclease HII n=1 Tax=Clostridium aceticum TaxID=84022 RepID=A0A0D8I6X1_9CLOT|nr:ribonuclease HII [Clostridium aceticum]AKL95496.1 ribonuclease HII [Clostridium aceticum]KJF25978.1 ribonuclease HII [Clostridium aceticum]
MELEIENSIWNEGYEKIACCDEVGRGCLFGSVLAAAVIFPKGLRLEGVKDSKKLSPKKREAMYIIISENALAIGIGIVPPEIIDKINIKNATRLAMKEAMLNLKDKKGNVVTPDYMLIDAEEIDINIPQKPIIKGDDLVHGIAAASIVAKVTRDQLCMDWHKKYPAYGIDQHKGYGTKVHREALMKYGATDMHRRSFLKKILL